MISYLELHPTSWPSADAVLDAWWKKQVNGQLVLDNLRLWLSTEKSNLVKRIGLPDARIFVISSYPTNRCGSSCHKYIGTVNNLSNGCMFDLRPKLAIAREDEYPATFVTKVITSSWVFS